MQRAAAHLGHSRKSYIRLPVEQRLQHKIAVMTYTRCGYTSANAVAYPYTGIRSTTASQLDHYGLRTVLLLLALPTTKRETAARMFRATAPKIWNSLTITVETQHHSTNPAAYSKGTCLATRLDDRHSNPAPLYRRHYTVGELRRRI